MVCIFYEKPKKIKKKIYPFKVIDDLVFFYYYINESPLINSFLENFLILIRFDYQIHQI
jgi:hypothetical protein